MYCNARKIGISKMLKFDYSFFKCIRMFEIFVIHKSLNGFSKFFEVFIIKYCQITGYSREEKTLLFHSNATKVLILIINTLYFCDDDTTRSVSKSNDTGNIDIIYLISLIYFTRTQ